MELGVGTGLNLPYYNTDNQITSYTAIDISPNMMSYAKSRFTSKQSISSSLQLLYQNDKVAFQQGDIGRLTDIFPSNKFDTIIDTFGLCVFPNPLLVLSRAKDLLSGGGQLLLLEHQDSVLGKALNPTRSMSDVSKSCRYDDDVLGLVRDAGFNVVDGKSVAGGFLIEVLANK